MKNKFVRSCQKNSKEVQEALFALGYVWSILGKKVTFLNVPFVFTNEDGSLTYDWSNKSNTPCLYDFTGKAKLVATLKPVNNRLTELREQADALMVKIKELEAKC